MKRIALGKSAIAIHVSLFIGFIGSTPVSAQTWRVVPSVDTTMTLTDNVSLAPDDRKESDLITQITPAVRVNRTGGRLRLNLNYRTTGILYLNESDRNRVQNYLNAVANYEAVDNWLFVDATGSITQQSVSAFGAQPDTANINANRAETATYALSPYITGRIGTTADYLVRYRLSTTQSRSGRFADTHVQEWLGRLSGGTAWRYLGWTIDGTHQEVDRDTGPDIESSRVGVNLNYQLDPQFRLRARAGYETNNYALSRRNTTNYGAGADWSPTERTQVSGFFEKRFFGDSREFSFHHRTRLTAWRFTDRRTVTVVPPQITAPTTGLAFDLLFNALASQIPDPVERALEVERRLAQAGIPPDLAVASGFLTTRVLIQEAQQASVTILGARNTVTFAAGLTESESLGTGSGIADDFTLSPTVEQRSLSGTWSHRLSPISSLNLLVSQVRSSGTAASGINSTQRSIRLLLSHRLGPRTSGTLGARLVDFDRSNAPGFSEKALTASLSVTF